jgi:hypothetical protein
MTTTTSHKPRYWHQRCIDDSYASLAGARAVRDAIAALGDNEYVRYELARAERNLAEAEDDVEDVITAAIADGYTCEDFE